MVYQPTTNFKDKNGADLGKKLVTQDYVSTVYPNLNSAFSGFVASPAELYLCGYSAQGQLGDNSTVGSITLKQEYTKASNWKEVSVGSYYSAAIKTDGTLWAWGYNYFSQLGDNTRADRSTPRQISIAAAGGLTGWKQVFASAHVSYATYAIRTDGTLWAWGYNYFGQLGDNTRVDRSTPRQISIAAAGGLTGWKQVVSGGSVGSVIGVRYDGTLWAWGYNNSGQLGDNTLSSRSTPRQISIAAAGGLTGWKKVSGGGQLQFCAAIRTDGTLWCWGNNDFGQLGDNTIVSRSTPRQEITSSTNWKQVATSHSNTGAIKTDGTLWAWGESSFGQLSINSTANIARSTPIQEFTSSNNWRQVAFGYYTLGAIKYPLNREY